MVKFAVKRSVWIRLVIALAILIIPASIYFFTYFNTKYDFAVQQRFRALNELEQQFTRGMSNFSNIFNFSADIYFTRNQRQVAKKVVADFRLRQKAWGKKKADQYLTPLFIRDLTQKEYEGWQIYLDPDISLDRINCNGKKISNCSKYLESYKFKLDQLEKNLKWTDPYFQKISSSPVYGNTIFDAVEGENCSNPRHENYFSTSFEIATPSEPFHLLVTDACSKQFPTLGKENGVVQARIPLRDLVQPDGALHYFDQILILNSEGQVLYRSGEEEQISIANSSGLPIQANRNDFARFADLSGLLQKASQTGGILELRNENSPDVALAATYSRVVEQAIGDMPHLFFLQPLRPPLIENNTKSNTDKQPWHVIGVVRKSQLLADVSGLSLNVMGALILILLLVLLVLPLLKLRFAAITEPIGKIQVYLIGTSLLLGTAIATLILLDLRAYGGLKDQMDETAMQISSRMRGEFDKELIQAIEFNKAAFPNELPTGQIPIPTCYRTGARGVESENIGNDTVWNEEHYPPYELAYQLDAEGRQAGCQRTYRDSYARRIAVPKRQYFLHARDGPVWESLSGDSFFLERIFTYDHGFWLTALSMPLKSLDVKEGGQAIATAQVRVTLQVMQSFFATVMPPAFGFAVLEDASGKVIYHSDNSRSLLENFYVETDNNERLTTTIRARGEIMTSGNYHGEGHRFYTAPLDTTPWSLVVFYDKTLMRTVNFETLISTTTALIFYVLAILLGLLTYRLIARHQRWRFIWPRTAVLREYRFFVLILLISHGLVWASTHDYSFRAIVLVLAIPLYTLSLAAFMLDHRQRWRNSLVTYRWKRIVTSFALISGLIAMSLSLWWSQDVLGQIDQFRTWASNLDASNKGLYSLLYGAIWSVAPLLLVLGLVGQSRSGQQYAPEKNHPGRERETRFWFLASALLVLILVSVWPAKLLFDNIYHLQTDKLLRMSQHHVLQRVEERRQSIQQELTRIHPESVLSPVTFIEEGRGIYQSPGIFDKPQTDGASEASNLNSGSQNFSYTGEPGPDPKNHAEDPDTTSDGKLENVKEPEAAKLYPLSILTENFPAYSSLAAWLHIMFSDLTICYDGCPGIEDEVLTYRKGDLLIKSTKIKLRGSQDIEILTALLVGTVLLFFLLRHALRSISQRILALDFPIIRMHWNLGNPKIWRDCRRIVLAPSKVFVENLTEKLQELGAVSEIDLSNSHDQQVLLKLASVSNRSEYAVIIVKTSKVFTHDQAIREQLLQALEKLNSYPETSLILYTTLFPWLNLALAKGQNNDSDLSDEENKRWQTLLRQFQCGYAIPDSVAELTSIEVLLKNECRNSELRELRQSIGTQPAFIRAIELQRRPAWEYISNKLAEFFLAHDPGGDALDEDDVIEEVTIRAEDFHRRMWGSCNKEEQYILYRMAQGNMINTLHIKLLERLLRLGLLRKEPEFRISSYSLRNFILSEETPEDIAEWESQTPESVWTYLRFPLLMLLLMLTVFLAFVGPSVVESLLGLIPAIVLALPLVLRLFSGSGK